MTRNIGTMKTPPYGVPMHPSEDNTPAVGEEVNLYLPDKSVPKSAEDIFVLGHYFAKPLGYTQKHLAYHFHMRSWKYGEIPGGAALNDLFLLDLRSVAYQGIFLHDFHSVVGHLGSNFHTLIRHPRLAKNFPFGTWHDIMLKAFFLEMLSGSYPTAGEALSKLWLYKTKYFGKAFSQLRTISTHPDTDEYSRAAALRVFGYTAPFFALANPLVKQGVVKHIAYFRGHNSPLVASAAMMSLNALPRIGR